METRQFFGTDGIRGPVGGPIICGHFFRRLGCGIGEFLQRISLPGPVAIGGDGRTSGKELRDAFVSGLPSEVEVLNLGILGTPAIAVATGFLGGAVGIALTASHNPATDNGIKFFDSNGRKWSSEWESLLEELLAAEKVCPEQTVTNVRNSHAAALFTYKEWWLRHFSPGALEGLGVVLDMANGATASYGAAFLESLGAAVIPMGNCPDGQNINGGCGSQWPEALAERVRAEGVPWGLAVDGDGDRALLCDSTGTVLAGEHLLARLAHLQFSKYPLVRPLLITTVQANGVLERHLPFEVLRTPVGDRSVAGAMARSDCLLGGEPSGHVLLPDWDVEGRGRGPAQRFCTADGLLAGALFLSTFLGENNRQLSANWNFPLNPTAVRSVAVVEKFPLEKALHFQAKKKQVAAALGENGRLLVRYSGTENRLRFLVEATDVAVAEQFVEELTGAFTLDMAHLSGEKGSVEKIKVGGAALEQARRTMEVEAAAIRATAERLTEDFTATVELLLNHRGKIILCGVGKSGFIA
ncbi:MAG: hypothetical protein LBS68_02185, partial [Puniceicoccales bacterium]|nr:hypothetical protein [Puniceicoccales bacterium]